MKKGRVQNTAATDEEPISLLPVMSLLIILIPFLVGNVAFVHFKTISVQTPGTSSEEQPQDEKNMNVVASVIVTDHQVELKLIHEETSKVVVHNKAQFKNPQHLEIFKSMMAESHQRFPRLETVMVRVEDNPRYEKLVGVLDVCKASREKMNVILLPNGVI